MWGAAQWLTGKAASGPPTQLSTDGVVTSSPAEMSDMMNDFFINKVDLIRQELTTNNIDPLVNFSNMLEGKQLQDKFKIRKIKMHESPFTF